jgi:hypothetical protein
MGRCQFCGGTKTDPQMLPCNVCHGARKVLSLRSDNAWLDVHPATASNKSLYSKHHEHVCPQCHGGGQLRCNAWFHG